MTVAATGSQGTDTYTFISKPALVSGKDCGTFHPTESFGVQGAKHWQSLEGCDDEKVWSYQRNITNGGTQIL